MQLSEKKHVLISGGTRGIGRAISRAFCSRGYTVTALFRADTESADMLSRTLGDSFEAICADVTDKTAVESAVTNSRFGQADIVVNNAGISMISTFDSVSPEDWKKMISTHLDGAYNCTAVSVRHMIRNGWGRIINISSVWGTYGGSCEVAYSTAKAGLVGFTKSLSRELGPSGITVNCVSPGVIDTDMNSSLSDDDLKELKNKTPLERIGSPDEIAGAVMYFASDDAGFVTGQVLGVDGGFSG